tara:strand:+ start:45 stop:380 length:336 start_codon:yes stop_codon:yes gene_type:complete
MTKIYDGRADGFYNIGPFMDFMINEPNIRLTMGCSGRMGPTRIEGVSHEGGIKIEYFNRDDGNSVLSDTCYVNVFGSDEQVEAVKSLVDRARQDFDRRMEELSRRKGCLWF